MKINKKWNNVDLTSLLLVTLSYLTKLFLLFYFFIIL